MKQPQIEITADGSATLYIPEIDEHYHSVKGALTERCIYSYKQDSTIQKPIL